MMKLIGVIFLLISCSPKVEQEPKFITDKAYKIIKNKCLVCHSNDRKLSPTLFSSREDILKQKDRIKIAVKTKFMPPVSNFKTGEHAVSFPPILSDEERKILLEELDKKENGTTDIKRDGYNDGEISYIVKARMQTVIKPRGFYYGCLKFEMPKKYVGNYIKKIKNISKDMSYIHHSVSKLVYDRKIKDEEIAVVEIDSVCSMNLQDSKESLIHLGSTPTTGFPVKEQSTILTQVHLDRSFDQDLNDLNYDKLLEFEIVMTKEVDKELYGHHFNLVFENDVIEYGKKKTLEKVMPISELSEEYFGKKGERKYEFDSIVTLFPHMHAAGVRFKIEAVDKGKTQLLASGNFDQHLRIYPINFVEPIKLDFEALKLSCYYDNSESNPYILFLNKEKKDIRYGFGGLDEMCTLFFNATAKKI